jgi:hypothetical protein
MMMEAVSSAMTMEAVYSAETSVNIYKNTWFHAQDLYSGDVQFDTVRGFSPFLQANTGIVPQLSHVTLFSNPFQFIPH